MPARLEAIRTLRHCPVLPSWRKAARDTLPVAQWASRTSLPVSPAPAVSFDPFIGGSRASSETCSPPRASARLCGHSLSGAFLPSSSHLSLPVTSPNSLSLASRYAFPMARCSPNRTESHPTPKQAVCSCTSFTPLTTPCVQSPTLQPWPSLSSTVQYGSKLIVLLVLTSASGVSIPAAVCHLSSNTYEVCVSASSGPPGDSAHQAAPSLPPSVLFSLHLGDFSTQKLGYS